MIFKCMLNRFVSVSVITIFLVSLSFGSLVLGNNLSLFSNDNEISFEIYVNNNIGFNEYSLIEIDEGDNDEETQITQILYEFNFSSTGAEVVNWDFGDGNTAIGDQVFHQYEKPGTYFILATSISSSSIDTDTLTVKVNLVADAEADNMECECAPTAKDTIIDLVTVSDTVIIEGYLTVEHDGSSESCSLRNPLQECHLRVILQYTQSGSIVKEQILFDDTFRSNTKAIDFSIDESTYEEGEKVQIRLETDQLRDWHKPTANWEIRIK